MSWKVHREVTVLFGGARALLPVYAVDVLHADAVGYGILSASLEAGTLIMALLLMLLPIPRRTGRTCAWGGLCACSWTTPPWS